MQTLTGVGEIAERGEVIYAEKIRALEATHRGQFAVIEVDSGDYEIDADEEAAAARLQARHPDTVFYVKRVGFPATEAVGSAL